MNESWKKVVSSKNEGESNFSKKKCKMFKHTLAEEKNKKALILFQPGTPIQHPFFIALF